MKLVVICCVFIAFSSTVIAASIDDTKMKLRFKSTGSRKLKLTVSRKTEIYETSWDRQREYSLYEGTNVFSYKVKSGKNNLLLVRARLYSSDKSVNGKLLQKGRAKEQVTSSFIIDSLGKRSERQKSTNDSSELDLQFPRKAVGSGDKWKVTVPSSDNFPAPIEMEFKIKKFIKKGSTMFCIINSTYETAALFLERGCRARVESKSRIIFNVSKGHVARVTGTSTFITTWLKEGLENPFQSARFATMKMIVQ